jgi:hypothetical protein
MQENNYKKNTFLAASYGLFRSGVSLAAEYPLECTKVRWQSQPQIHFFKVVANTYRQDGFLGFYNGLIPHAIRRVPAYVYRWPMLLQLPKFYETYFPARTDSLNDKLAANVFANFLTGVTIATVEAPLAAPVETCKLALIVNKNTATSIREYLKNQTGMRSHYLGFRALYLKELFGWSSYMMSCNAFRFMMNHNEKDWKISPGQLILGSAMVGMANTLAIMPWDVIRTRIQAQQTHKTYAPVKMREVAKNILGTQGLKGFYTGWQIRFLQMSIATLLSLPVMQRFDEQINVESQKMRI